jgi:hypothetical protein
LNKIFTDDPLVSYATTTIGAERTRDQISAILREYDVADIHWHWKPEINDVYVQFVLEEIIDGNHVRVAVKVIMPIIWEKEYNPVRRKGNSKKPHPEQVNLDVSMRVIFYYIKSHLEAAYAMQSSRVAGFLPDMLTQNGKRFFDTLKERLDQFEALEYSQEPEKQREVEVIKPKNITNGAVD